jgi:hypothetical protein
MPVDPVDGSPASDPEQAVASINEANMLRRTLPPMLVCDLIGSRI